MRTVALGALVLAACASESDPTQLVAVEPIFKAKCAAPRTGTDLFGNAFLDQPGTVDDEKFYLLSWTDDLYLWYDEVPTLSPGDFATPVDYFATLKTPRRTASGKPKDQFHFTYPTDFWQSLSSGGVEPGYGVEWALPAQRPPRTIVVAYTQPDVAPSVARGARVLAVDGADAVNGVSVEVLNAGLFPADVNESHTFRVLDAGATTPRDVILTSSSVTKTPVQSVKVLETPTGNVGYFHFTDFVGPSEKQLLDAVTALEAAGVTDLVVDLRYNGGGYLDIAAQLGYMVAGPARTNRKVFEATRWNARHPAVDPVTESLIVPLGFESTTYGFSTPTGTPLPSLSLPRVFVLTTAGTCSASEAVMNGLSGVDVDVVQIGSTTCGKPYAFYPQDNCGTTYFSIEFEGMNDKGFGDYADGFVPGGALHGCLVADDFAHGLGDPDEALLAAALAYRATGSCPPAKAAPEIASPNLRRTPFRENRILSPPRSPRPR